MGVFILVSLERLRRAMLRWVVRCGTLRERNLPPTTNFTSGRGLEGLRHVSLVNNYRSQFNRILTSSTYDELVLRIKAKLSGKRGQMECPKRIPRRAASRLVVLRGRHGTDEQADISADPDPLPHPALRGVPRNTDHTALNHSGQVTNEQVTVKVKRDQGRMLTETVVGKIII